MSIRLVLVRPQNAENVGAAARAMKNFGLSDWVWIDPAFTDLEPARRLAVHAAELLQTARVEATLEAALQGCAWVVATSSRHRERKRRLSPREVAREAAQREGQGPVALVFGDERSGLTNAEIDRCQALSAVPTHDSQPSMNLAQAVLLYGYELRLAALEAAPREAPPDARLALTDEIAALTAALEAALTESRFLVAPGRHALRDLVAPLVRARLSAREARLWEAALRSLGRR